MGKTAESAKTKGPDQRFSRSGRLRLTKSNRHLGRLDVYITWRFFNNVVIIPDQEQNAAQSENIANKCEDAAYQWQGEEYRNGRYRTEDTSLSTIGKPAADPVADDDWAQ